MAAPAQGEAGVQSECRGTENGQAGWRFIFGRLGLLLLTSLILVICGSLFSQPRFKPRSDGTSPIASRLLHFQENNSDYDLLFIGDSRTYVGLHPEIIDPILKSRSLNLASFSNWMPTNVSLIQDLAPKVPKGTTVIWSVGHVNFVPGQTIQRVYPISFPLAIWYERIGLKWKGLWDNAFYYNRYLNFLVTRAESLDWFKRKMKERVRLDSVFGSARASTVRPSADYGISDTLASRLMREPEARKAFSERMAKDQKATHIDFPMAEGKVNSIVLFMAGGGYFRIELDHEFFRSKQKASPRPCEDDGTCSVPKPHDFDPVIVSIFEEGLRTFKRFGVNVIVNELEETPYVYPSAARRRVFREKMKTDIASIVERYGYSYVTTPLERLQSKDYFDYNHLNSEGISKYSPMLVNAIQDLWQAERARAIAPTAQAK